MKKGKFKLKNRLKNRKWFIRFFVLVCLVVILTVSAIYINKNNKPKVLSNGNLISISGEFTERKIKTEEDAIKAAEDASKELGTKNEFKGLKKYSNFNFEKNKYYKLKQYYEGLPVYNRFVTVIASNKGEAKGLIASSLNIDKIGTKPKRTTDQICDFIENNNEIIGNAKSYSIILSKNDNLVIYLKDDKALLAYSFYAQGLNYNHYVIDANDGTILEATSQTNLLKGKYVEGNDTFPIEKDNKLDKYYIEDSVNNIKIFNLKKHDSKKDLNLWHTDINEWNLDSNRVSSTGNTIFGDTSEEKSQNPKTAINLYKEMKKIIQFYKNNFNEGIPGNTLMLEYNDSFEDGTNALGGLTWKRTTIDDRKYTDDFVASISLGYRWNGSESSVLAHEYTHSIAHNYDIALGDGSESKTIQEGLADTFSYFFTGKWKLINYDGSILRIANDKKMTFRKFKKYVQNHTEITGHEYASLVSRIAYLMNQSGAFSKNELKQLWFNTMICLPYSCTFYDLRLCMQQIANIRGLSDKQYNKINDIFNKLDIKSNDTNASNKESVDKNINNNPNIQNALLQSAYCSYQDEITLKYNYDSNSLNINSYLEGDFYNKSIDDFGSISSPAYSYALNQYIIQDSYFWKYYFDYDKIKNLNSFNGHKITKQSKDLFKYEADIDWQSVSSKIYGEHEYKVDSKNRITRLDCYTQGRHDEWHIYNISYKNNQIDEVRDTFQKYIKSRENKGLSKGEMYDGVTYVYKFHYKNGLITSVTDSDHNAYIKYSYNKDNKLTEIHYNFYKENGLNNFDDKLRDTEIKIKYSNNLVSEMDFPQEMNDESWHCYKFTYVNSNTSSNKNNSKNKVNSNYKTIYKNYINSLKDYKSYDYSLVDINEDGIPELFINRQIGAKGESLYTISNNKLKEIGGGQTSFDYIKGKNLILMGYGHQDEYEDNIYKIEKGNFKLLGKGRYGASDNSNVQWNEDGPIYNYYWNKKKVSKNQYNKSLNKLFDTKKAISLYDKGVSYNNIIKQLS